MPAVYSNFKAGSIDVGISNVTTTLSSPQFAFLPAIASPDTMWLVLDPESIAGTPEVVQITSHTSLATTVTVNRGQQTASGGFAARSHSSGTRWVAAWTADDGNAARDASNLTAGTVPSGRLTGAYTGVTGLGTLTSLTTRQVTISAVASPTANLTEWQTSTGTVLSAIDTTGKFTGVAANATKLETARTIAGKTFDGTQNVTLSTLTRGTYLTGLDFDGSTATTWAVDATSGNTVNKIVARDNNGDFSARIITASLTGNASTASQWLTARTITLGTDLSGSVSINGSTNVTLNATITPTTGTGNFVRATSPVLTGIPSVSAAGGPLMQFKASGITDHGYLEFYVDTDSLVTRSGYFGWSFASTNVLTVANQMTNGHLNLVTNGSGIVQANGNTIWHAANDGAGSTLDADLLDGQHGSWYQDWANITNKPDPVITLSGDVGGTATMTDLGSITIGTTIQPNSVAIGTDTTGQYARTLAGTTNRITVTAPNADDGTDYTLNLPQDIHTTADTQFASTRLLNTVNTNVVLTVQGEATQVADLQRWQTASATLARVDTIGRATFKEVYVDTSTTGTTYRIGMLGGTPGSTVDPSKLYIVADPTSANTTPSHVSVTTPFYVDSLGNFSLADTLFFIPGDTQTFGRLTVIGRIRGAIENTPIVPTDSGQFTVDQVVISGTTPHQTAVIRTTAQHTFNVGDTVVVAGIDGASNASAANGAWQITAKTTVSPFTFTIGGISGAVNGTYTVTGTARVRELTLGLHPAFNGSPAGLGIRLDEYNYWFVNNRFRVGAAASFMEWNGTNLRLSGAVIANGGDFQTAVTVNNGTMKIGKDASGAGSDGIYIGASGDYWYSTGAFRIGGSTGIAYTGSGRIAIGSSVDINGSAVIGGSITGASITIGTGFSVTNTGLMTAISGTIGGWTLANDRLTGGSTTLNSNGSLTVGANFSVNTTGVLTATGATISGTITAASGTIGGWTIGALAITGGTTTLNSNGSITAGTNFSVSTTGVLTAAGANISGTVTASSGTIGGWTLASDRLFAGSTSTYVAFSTGASSGGYAFWAGSATPASAGFNVTNTGLLNASGATISGSVSANAFTLLRSNDIVSTLGSVTINNVITGTPASGARLTLNHLNTGVGDSYLGWTADVAAGTPSVLLSGPDSTVSLADAPKLQMSTDVSNGNTYVDLRAPIVNGGSVLNMNATSGALLSNSKPGSVAAALYLNSTGISPAGSPRNATGVGGVTLEYYNIGSFHIAPNFAIFGVEDNTGTTLAATYRSWLKFNRGASWTSELRSDAALSIQSTLGTITHTVATAQTHNFVVDATTRASVTGTGLTVTGTLGVSGLATLSGGATVTGTVAATTFSGSGASLTSIPNSATTATSANTINAIVARDSTGAFIAGAVTVSSITSSGNITFPNTTDVGLRNTAGSSYFHLDRSISGNSQWKVKSTATAFIDADTFTVRNSFGSSTYATFNSSGLTVSGITLGTRTARMLVNYTQVQGSGAGLTTSSSTPSTISGCDVTLNSLKAGDVVIINATFDIEFSAAGTGPAIGHLFVNGSEVSTVGRAVLMLAGASERANVSQTYQITLASDGNYQFQLRGSTVSSRSAVFNPTHTAMTIQVFSND